MQPDRRLFLARAARLASLAALASAFPGATIARTSSYPFSLGVASGSPRPTSVVLWTRVLPDPLDVHSVAPAPLRVRWEMAEDENFRRIAAKGSTTALPELAHSVHVDVAGLRPDRWYWYRFLLGDAVSPVGRTRTAPADDAMPASLRFAFASCQHWEFGEYAAHRHIAAAAPDLVAFLGDYIYEWGPYRRAHPAEPQRVQESITLTDYRARYAQYKSDPQLQASHHAAPWIVTWDDHEVANDYANDQDPALDKNFLTRRAAAYQAFYEHMPIRLPLQADAPNRFDHFRLHDRYQWGQLAQFHVLDDRQYRAHQACPQPGRGGANTVTMACKERLDPTRSMLGAQQEGWLDEGLATSGAKWNILAQQTFMAQSSQTPIVNPEEDGRFWTEGWDGYPAARQRLLDSIAKHRPANPLVISGDVHTFYAADLKGDFNRPTSADNPVLASEFCGTSVTSASLAQKRIDEFVASNPHIKLGRSDRRGFVMMEVTPAQTTAQFLALDDVHKADSGVTMLASFVVEEGRAGVVRTDRAG